MTPALCQDCYIKGGESKRGGGGHKKVFLSVISALLIHLLCSCFQYKQTYKTFLEAVKILNGGDIT